MTEPVFGDVFCWHPSPPTDCEHLEVTAGASCGFCMSPAPAAGLGMWQEQSDIAECQTEAAPPGNGDSCSKLGTAPKMMDLGAQRGLDTLPATGEW